MSKHRAEKNNPLERKKNFAMPDTHALQIAILAVIVLVIFCPGLTNGFVNWDDDKNFLYNYDYRGLGWKQLAWMFTKSIKLGNYEPLNWVIHGFTYSFFGMSPGGYHFTGLMFHVLVSVAFYLVVCDLLRFTRYQSGISKKWVALFAALLFAIHPLRVEIVSWISGQHYAPATLFYLLAILFYFRYCEATSARLTWLIRSVAAFAISLFIFPIGITLPFALLLFDIYPLKRFRVNRESASEPTNHVFFEKIPFFAVSTLSGIAMIYARKLSSDVVSLQSYSVWDRCAQSLFGVAFYLWKSLFPFNLSPLYEFRYHLNSFQYILAAIAVILSGAITLLYRRWVGLATVFIFYLLTISPTLGFTQTGVQLVADRYSYIACLGWPIVIVIGLQKIIEENKFTEILKKVVYCISVLCAICLVMLTWRQIGIWRNPETLWMHVVSLDPQSSRAQNNLADALSDRGNQTEAISHYKEALRLQPDYADADYNMANALVIMGDLDSAISSYQKALILKPQFAKASNNLGIAFFKAGRLDDAIGQYRETLKMPDASSTNVFYNLALAFYKTKKISEAIQVLEDGHRAQPWNQEIQIALENFHRIGVQNP